MDDAKQKRMRRPLRILQLQFCLCAGLGLHNVAEGFHSPLRPTRAARIRKITTWRGGSHADGSSPLSLDLARTPVALPTCSAANTYKVIAGSGSAALLAQFVLSRMVFARSKDPVLSRNAAYTAHTVVAFILMVLVSYIGVVGWWWNPFNITDSGAVDRLLVASDASRWLCSCILGAFLFWDIPTSIYIPALRKVDVVIHHVIMAIVATVSITKLPAHYALYYFGVSELSSIPLLLYDQWEQNCKVLTDDTTNQPDREARLERAMKQRDKFKVIAAVAFTLIRAVSFTKVTFFNYLPDCWAALPTAKRIALGGSLKFVMVSCAGFATLQLYWFSGIVRIILSGDKSSDLHEA